MVSVADQLTAVLGTPLPATARELRFCCPQCDRRGKTPDTGGHLYINPTKGLFFCQRCEWKGTTKWLLKHFGISSEPTVQSWADTIRRLRVITGEDYTEPYDYTEEIEYPCGTSEPLPGYNAYTYLTAPKTYRLGKLLCRGLHPSQISAYHIRLGAPGTKWEDRIFIPTLIDDRVTFWVARDMKGYSKLKYLNPKDRSRRFHVFNLHRATQYQDVVITEGVFSAIAAGPNAIATFGKYVTADQLVQLHAADFQTYYVALDGDAKPQTLYVAQWLHSRGKRVRIVVLPDWGDPDSVLDFPQRLAEAEPFTFRSRVNFVLNRFE